MTHSEECGLNAEVVVVEAAGECIFSGRSDGGRVDGDRNTESGENEDLRSTWTSLDASFGTTPLQDSFVTTPKARRDNGQAVGDVQRRGIPAPATATSLARADCGSLTEEQGRYTMKPSMELLRAPRAVLLQCKTPLLSGLSEL